MSDIRTPNRLDAQITRHLEGALRARYEQEEAEAIAVLTVIAIGCNLPLWKVMALCAIEQRKEAVADERHRIAAGLAARTVVIDGSLYVGIGAITDVVFRKSRGE